MAGRPRAKLNARDLAAMNRAGNIGLRYPPGGGPAQVRVASPGGKRQKGRRR